MKQRTVSQWFRRVSVYSGLMVAGLGASSGLVTASTSWASGVSVSSDAQAMASQDYTYPLTFDASVENALSELQSADPDATQTVTEFYGSYVSATKDYGTALLSAADLYAQNYQSDPAGARNAYIDSFGNARAAYFGELESARNSVVVELSGTNDVAKDMFVNEYNAARDTYNNQLESIKNQIASLTS